MGVPKVILIDHAARDQAVARIDQSYCVEAAAGTGKTYLMIQRLLTLVTKGVDLTTVAAITFTEKAAAELQARLREGIEKGRTTAETPKDTEHFSAALEQIDRSSISTIHAFAASLLRERPVEAGIDPGFEVLDEMGSQLLFDEVWQTWKREQLGSAPPVVRRLLSLGIKLGTVEELARKLLANRDIVVLVQPSNTSPPTNQIWDEVVGLVRKLGALKKKCADESDLGYQHIEELEAVVERTPADELSRERALMVDFKVGSRGQKGNWRTGACDQQKDICRQLKETIAQAPKRLGPSLTAAVLVWLKSFLD
ncbi:MAG: UvrD-helicase domain-containing protein, partial [Terriglobales bacterium]